MDSPWVRRLPGCLARRVAGRPQLQAILVNSGWLVGDRVLRMVGGLVVGVWMARYLGPERFGIYNYAAAFAAFMMPFVTLGLDDLVVRDLVRLPDRQGALLGTAFALKAAAGMLGVAAVGGAVALARPGDGTSLALGLILSGGLLAQAFDVTALWFRSRVQSRYVVYPRNAAFLALSVVKIGLILGGAPLLAFAVAAAAEIALGTAGVVAAYRWRGGRVAWTFDRAVAVALLRESWPLVVAGAAGLVYMRIGQVLLGDMVGDRAVGIYATATRLSEIWYFIPTIIASSVAPALIQARTQGEQAYYGRLQRVFNAMTLISLPIAVAMTFLARPVVALLFGPAYQAAAPVLAIHVWAGCFVFLGVARQVWIIAEGYTRAALGFSVVGAVANVLLSLLLIPRYQEIGAAVAAVVSYFISDYLVFVVYPPFRRIGAMMTRALLLSRAQP